MSIFGNKAREIINKFQLMLERNVIDVEGLGKVGCYENESRNNKGDAAYFKVKTKNGEARIKFSKAEYVVHKGSITLTKTQKDKLVNALSKKVDKDKTLWDKLNDEYESMTKEKSEFRNHIPDYSKLPNKIKK